MISRFMDHPWPSRSPNLSPLDHWFCGAAMQEVRIAQSATVKELTMIVEEFAVSLQPAEIRKCVSQSLYISLNGACFESHSQLNPLRQS